MQVWQPKELNKRVYILGGERGSGKSELALNLALALREQFAQLVYLLDLDSLKPVFRSRDLKTQLSQKGVSLLATPISSLDLPNISQELAGVLRTFSFSQFSVIDLAGEPEGARILGGYRDSLVKGYEFFLVLNVMRPFARDFNQLLSWTGEIAGGVGLPFTGVINNTNLRGETNREILKEGAQTAEKLAKTLKVPLVFHSVKAELLKEDFAFLQPVFPLKLFIKAPWELENDKEKI